MGMRIKKKITKDNDYYHSVRVVLRTVNRDIALAYHDLSDTAFAASERSKKEFEGILLERHEPKSFFIGTKEKLFFTSSTHQRMYKNTNETDTCKISYYLEPDKNDPRILNLIKTETTFIDDNMDYKGSKYILAYDVQSINFRYYSPEGISDDGTWTDRWNSNEGERVNTFPMAVELSIVFPHESSQDNKMEFIEKIKIINPNNIDVPQPLKTGEIS
jgi:general secretion pathway protein J